MLAVLVLDVRHVEDDIDGVTRTNQHVDTVKASISLVATYAPYRGVADHSPNRGLGSA